MNCILTLLEMSAQLSFVVVFLLVKVHLCLLHWVSSHHITILLHPTIMVWSHASLVMLETTSCVLLTVLVSATGFVIVESLIGPLTIVIHATSIVSTHGLLTWCTAPLSTSSSTASVGAAVLVAILPLNRFHGENHLLFCQWILWLPEFSISMSEMAFVAK
jgi:hypothetical protein